MCRERSWLGVREAGEREGGGGGGNEGEEVVGREKGGVAIRLEGGWKTGPSRETRRGTHQAESLLAVFIQHDGQPLQVHHSLSLAQLR